MCPVGLYGNQIALRQSKKQARERGRRAVIQQFLFAYLLTHPCSCGEANPVVLEFHHVCGPKKFAITRGASLQYGLRTLEAEIAKCEVKCMKCHRIETAKVQNWTRYQLYQKYLEEKKRGHLCAELRE